MPTISAFIVPFSFQSRLPCTMPTVKRCERQGVVSCLSLHIRALGRFLPWNIGREPAVQGRCVPCTHRIVAVCTLELSLPPPMPQCDSIAVLRSWTTCHIRSRERLAPVLNRACHNIATLLFSKARIRLLHTERLVHRCCG